MYTYIQIIRSSFKFKTIKRENEIIIFTHTYKIENKIK